MSNNRSYEMCNIMFKMRRSEEHTSELQSRETISYAVFCLKKKKKKKKKQVIFM